MPLYYTTVITKFRIKVYAVLVWFYSFVIWVCPTLGWNTWHPGVFCDYLLIYHIKYLR